MQQLFTAWNMEDKAQSTNLHAIIIQESLSENLVRMTCQSESFIDEKVYNLK